MPPPEFTLTPYSGPSAWDQPGWTPYNPSDPFPPSPGQTPPPGSNNNTPPPQSPTPALPSTPPPANPASNNDISNLGQLLGVKLDAIYKAVAVVVQAVDTNTNTTASGNQDTKNAITAAGNAIVGAITAQGPNTQSSNGVDLTATNGKLDTANAHLDKIEKATGHTASGGLDCTTPPLFKGPDGSPEPPGSYMGPQQQAIYMEWKQGCNAKDALEGKALEHPAVTDSLIGAGPGSDSNVSTTTDTNGVTVTTTTSGHGLFSDTTVSGGVDGGTGPNGGSCPTMPPVTFHGTVIQADTTKFCEWMVLGGKLVLLFAALAAVKIIGSPQ